MNVAELIKKAETIVEEGYDTPTWEGIIESVLADLNTISKVLSSALLEVTVEDGIASIEIAEDLSDMYEVVAVSFAATGKRMKLLRRLALHDSVSTGWMRDSIKILIQNLDATAGEVRVDYYAKLAIEPVLDSNEKVFNLPEEYHETILKGVLSMVAQKEEEYDRKNDFFGEYMLAKKEMLAKRVQEVEPWYAQVVAPARLGGS